MSTVVYQGVQSCLESQLVESRTLKLKLYSPETVVTESVEMSLQSCIVPADYSKNLPSVTPETLFEKLQAPYVHSSVKRASWWLSEKSLSLCTENLGSETGSEFVENSIFSPPASSSSTTENNNTLGQREHKQFRNRRVPEPKKQFPPILTTLSGPECLNIIPQREHGRLILKVTRTTPARRSCFQVDRSNGRLRLSLTNSNSNTNMHVSNEEDIEVANDQKVTNMENKYKDEIFEKNIPELASCSSYEESIIKVERIEMTKYLEQQRRGLSASCSRCKESHKNNNMNTTKKGLMNLMVKVEPRFLVA